MLLDTILNTLNYRKEVNPRKGFAIIDTNFNRFFKRRIVMSKITKSLGYVLLCALLIIGLSSYAQEAKFVQLSENGLVCMEAENYSGIDNPIDDSYWSPVTEPDGYSGTGAMQAMPIDPNFTRHKTLDDARSYAPYMSYTVNFVATGTHYVWARTVHTDGYDDSAWMGLDYEIVGGTGDTPTPIQYNTDEQEQVDWYWISHLMDTDSPRATIEVESAGVHTFNLYMREQALRVDKIVLTTNADYLPDAEANEGPAETLAGGSGVELADAIVARSLQLDQNYPNPFNPVTSISYSLPEAQIVTLKIFDLNGKAVDVLVNEFQTAGRHEVQWVAEGFPSGIYFYQIQAGAFSETKKLILQK
jgi:hypothetical protein